jgi:prophage tail gpP-like protein
MTTTMSLRVDAIFRKKAAPAPKVAKKGAKKAAAPASKVAKGGKGEC